VTKKLTPQVKAWRKRQRADARLQTGYARDVRDNRGAVRSVCEKFGRPDYPMTANICADYGIAMLDYIEELEAKLEAQ